MTLAGSNTEAGGDVVSEDLRLSDLPADRHEVLRCCLTGGVSVRFEDRDQAGLLEQVLHRRVLLALIRQVLCRQRLRVCRPTAKDSCSSGRLTGLELNLEQRVLTGDDTAQLNDPTELASPLGVQVGKLG